MYVKIFHAVVRLYKKEGFKMYESILYSFIFIGVVTLAFVIVKYAQLPPIDNRKV